MTSKLKRPAPCFFPSGVEEGGRSDRTTGIRELGGYTSLLLLAHRLEGGIQGPASSYRSPGTNTGTQFLIQKENTASNVAKASSKINPTKQIQDPHTARYFLCAWVPMTHLRGNVASLYRSGDGTRPGGKTARL